MIISPKFSLNKTDIEKVLKNALVFAGPALIVLIGSFVNLVPKDASWSVVALYLINVATDALRKYLNRNSYPVTSN